jgi:hypothetical protein
MSLGFAADVYRHRYCRITTMTRYELVLFCSHVLANSDRLQAIGDYDPDEARFSVSDLANALATLLDDVGSVPWSTQLIL